MKVDIDLNAMELRLIRCAIFSAIRDPEWRTDRDIAALKKLQPKIDDYWMAAQNYAQTGKTIKKDWQDMRESPIQVLQPDEVFVFGSNLAGRHGKGAALQARVKFGAKAGVGEGLTGQTYAFPTLGHRLEKRSMEDLAASRDRLYDTCRAYPQKRFLLTKVGCGLAGYEESAMRELFRGAPGNVVMPEGW